jgi:hypothetical protein
MYNRITNNPLTYLFVFVETYGALELVSGGASLVEHVVATVDAHGLRVPPRHDLPLAVVTLVSLAASASRLYESLKIFVKEGCCLRGAA